MCGHGGVRGATLAWQIFQPVRVSEPSLCHQMAPWGIILSSMTPLRLTVLP